MGKRGGGGGEPRSSGKGWGKGHFFSGECKAFPKRARELLNLPLFLLPKLISFLIAFYREMSLLTDHSLQVIVVPF